MSELWDAYDIDLNKIPGITLIRGEDVPDGMYHLVCDILVQHEDGTYLLMKRHPDKAFGDMWEASAGGSAIKGETPEECAKRELFEETGVVAEDITYVGKVIKSGIIYCEFVCKTKRKEIKMQEGETVDFRWATEEELKELRDEGTLLSQRMSNFVSQIP